MAAVESEVLPQEGQDDLRATLTAAYKEVSERDTAEPDNTATTETVPAGERPRDERGRFSQKNTDEAADSAVTPQKAEPPATGAKQEAPPESAAPAAATIEPPPISWNSEAKAKWGEVPQELRQFLAQREDMIHREFSKRDLEREYGRELHKTIAPYEAMIRAEGSDPARAVASLLNTAYILRTGSPELKAQALRQVAQTFNVDLGSAAQPQSEVPQYVLGLQSELAQLKGYLAQQQQTAQQSELAQLNSMIETFRADPKHPHFDKVNGVMAALLQSEQAKDLEEAYSMAVWARPDLRSTLTVNQSTEAQQRNQVKTQEARRKAAASVRSGVGGSAPVSSDPNRSLREEIRAAMEESRGRV